MKHVSIKLGSYMVCLTLDKHILQLWEGKAFQKQHLTDLFLVMENDCNSPLASGTYDSILAMLTISW